MAKSVANRRVEEVLRSYLKAEGCTLSVSKKQGETGADIVAKRGEFTWIVEAIGFQDKPPVRSREFYEAFFRVISRDRDVSNHILVLGLPMRFKQGMRQRMQQYPVAWGKLGKVFSSLQIWYVDTEMNTVEERPWSAPVD